MELVRAVALADIEKREGKSRGGMDGMNNRPTSHSWKRYRTDCMKDQAHKQQLPWDGQTEEAEDCEGCVDEAPLLGFEDAEPLDLDQEGCCGWHNAPEECCQNPKRLQEDDGQDLNCLHCPNRCNSLFLDLHSLCRDCRYALKRLNRNGPSLAKSRIVFEDVYHVSVIKPVTCLAVVHP